MCRQKCLTATVALVLSACGGGGQETDARHGLAQQRPGPGAGAVSGGSLVLAAPAAVAGSTRVVLTWTAPAAFKNFSVWLAPDGTSEFKPMAANLAGDARRAEVDRGVAWQLDFLSARIRLRGCDATARCFDSNEQPLLAALLGTVVEVAPPNVAFEEHPVRISTDGNTLAMRRGSSQLGVYHRTPEGRWQTEAVLDLPSPGTELSLSGDGNTAVVDFDQDGVSSALVLVRDAMHRWSRQAVLTPRGPASPVFGSKLAISEDGNLVASSGNVAGASGKFQVFVFARDGAGRWSQDSAITEPIDSPTPLDPLVGLALSPNGQLIAVTTYAGANVGMGGGSFDPPFHTVRVYRRDGQCHTWRMQADLRSDRWPYPSGRYFMTDDFGHGGIEFDGAGKRLVVGASQQPPGNENYEYRLSHTYGPTPGAVYVFDAAGGAWQRSARIDNVNWPREDGFGHDLSLSRDGKTLAATTCGFFAALARNRNHPADRDASDPPGGDPNGPWRCKGRSAAYIYSVDDQGHWVFHTSVLPSGNHERERPAVRNVVLSGDGRTLAVKWLIGTGGWPESEPMQHNHVVVY